MSLPSVALHLLPTVPVLDDTNWFTFQKKLRMYFLGCGVPEIMTGVPPTETAAKATFDKLNGQYLGLISTKVAESFQYLIDDEEVTTASAAYVKLKEHFQKSTVGHRMAARREFYSVTHDPDIPISQYIQAVSAAKARLVAFGVEVKDAETVDVLLMNLHESYHHVRSSILMAKDEPSSATVIANLTGSATATEVVSIKTEESGPVLASRAVHGGRMGRFGSSTGDVRSGSGSGPKGRVDVKGFTWCDVTLPNACHRCGHPGHIAARCMYTMPEHVKEWIISTTSRSRSRSPPRHTHHGQAHHHGHQATELEHAGAAFTADLDDYNYDTYGGTSPLLI